MSFETDLAKFKKQVDSFSIAGAAGNFHTGFSIGDDTRGAGAGVRQTTPNTPEEVLAHLENSFKNFSIRGGHDVSVSGSLVAGGFAISAKAAPSGDSVGGGGPPPPPPGTGACCVDLDCSIQTLDDCIGMSGTYQGDDTVCDPNPCSTCPTCTAHVHIEFSIDFDGPCNVSTTEDHDVLVSWLDCDLTTSSEKFDLTIPLTLAVDDPLDCFGGDLVSAYYEIFAFYDTSAGWNFTFKIHLGAGSFDTAPDDPGPGLENLDALGTLCQTAYGGTSCVYFTCL